MKITKKHVQKLITVIDAGLCSGVGEPIPGRMCVEAAVCYSLGLPFGDDPVCVSRALRAVKISLNDSGWSSNIARAKGMKKLAIAQLGSRDALDDVAFTKRLIELTIRRVVPRALRYAAKLQGPEYAAKLEAAAVRCEQEGTEAAARASYAADAAARAADAAYAYAADAADAAYAYAADAAARAARAAAAADAAAAYAAAYAYAADAAADAAARAARAAAYAYAADAAADAAVLAAARDEELTFFADLVLEILVEMNAPGVKWLTEIK